MSTTDSVTRDAFVANAMAITEREMRVYGERTRASQVATDARPQGDAGGRPVELPGLRATPHRRAPRVGLADDRRRRQRVRRLRHGLRRAVRRTHASGGAACRRSPARSRHALRHAVRARRRGGRAAGRPLRAADVASDQLRDRGDDGCHPPRPWRHQAGQDRQGRRRVPRPPRRGDDLQQAAARQGRAGRCAELGAAVGAASRGHRRRRHRDPVQRP